MTDKLISLTEAAERFRMRRKTFKKEYVETGKILVLPRKTKRGIMEYVSVSDFNELIESEKMIHRNAV